MVVAALWLFGAIFTPALMIPLGVSLGITGVAFLPVVGIWLALAGYLGKRTQQRLTGVTDPSRGTSRVRSQSLETNSERVER